MESRRNVEVLRRVEVLFRNFNTTIFVKPNHTIADMKRLVLLHPHQQTFAGSPVQEKVSMKSLLKNSRIYQNGVACADYALVKDFGVEGSLFRMIMKEPDAPVISEINLKPIQRESELDNVIIDSLEKANWATPLKYYKMKKKDKKADQILDLKKEINDLKKQNTKMKEENKTLKNEAEENSKSLNAQVTSLKLEKASLKNEIRVLKEKYETSRVDKMNFDELMTLARRGREARDEMDRRLLCQICFDQRKQCAFYCGHQFCSSCAHKVNRKCPVCRKFVQGRINLF